MPERDGSPYHIGDGKAVQSIHPYQSSWMSHWMGTSCDASPHMQNYLTRPTGNMGDDHGSAKGIGEVETRTNEIINESLAMSSKNLRNERVDSQSFPIFKLCQESGRSSILKSEKDATSGSELRPQVAHKKLTATETSSREFHFQPEGVLQVPAEQVKYHMFFGESSYSKGKISESASYVKLDPGEYKFDSGTTAIPSLIRRQEEINQLNPVFESKEYMSKTNLTILGQEHSNYHSQSAVLVRDEKLTNFPKSEKSVTPYLRQNNSAVWKNDPSTSSKHSPALGDTEYWRMQNHFGIGFFPSQNSPPEMIKPGKFNYGQCSLQTIPNFVQDVDTMRICSHLDPAEGLAGGVPRFSQTTHSLLITKHTDVNLCCKENQIFRGSRLLTQLEENTFSKLHTTSLLFGHGQGGVKLQLLGGSTDSEEMENVEHVKTSGVVQKNESSAETDTMDMEPFKEKNNLSGVNSSPSNKDNMVEKQLSPQATTGLATEEVRQGKRIIELPDINLELPALPAASSSMEKAEPSTSRTQSLDMDTLLFQVDQTTNVKLHDCPESLLGPEPISRWIKRLKSSASNSLALGTKSSNLSAASSHGKLSKFFSKIMEGGTSRSRARMGKHHDDKELTAPDQKTATLRKGESSSVETRKDSQDITLSHSWIQRWCHNQASKNPENVATCQVQSSKLALAEFQKKQFPSIAAMALMGKAMRGFQQCEFQKRDSFVVWNAKNF